jgi:predicted NAD/FAD-binding protein
VAAQARWGEISGAERRTHFCGAYWGWGFHEDGVVSALRACQGIETGTNPTTIPSPGVSEFPRRIGGSNSDTSAETVAA